MKYLPWRRTRAVVALAAVAIIAGSPAGQAQGRRSSEQWVGTWATALVARPPAPSGQAQQGRVARPALHFRQQTLRQIVHTSIGGERVRVTVSNRFGTAPLEIGAAHVALREKDAAIAANSGRALTFGGRSSVAIAPGAQVVSDPADLQVPALADLAIDLYLPGDTASSTSPLTFHSGAFQTSYVSESGNHAGAATMPVMTTMRSWYFLGHVAVSAPEQAGALVAIGASTTDGNGSTVDANARWPDHLARRLAAQNVGMGVLNVGIGGNRVLGAGSVAERFERDVLEQPGVTHVIVLSPLNDIRTAGQNPSPSADDLIGGYRTIIAQARARNLTIYGATLMPFGGDGAWTKEGEAKRQAINQWMRTSKEYDGVFDFDAVLRDPGEPAKMQAKYDSGDHLHPNDAGYEALANVIDINLLKSGRRMQQTAAVVP